MHKMSKRLLKRIALFIICAIILICVPIVALSQRKSAVADENKFVLNVWQIDSFEGGKGSRTAYLQNIADKFSKDTSCYLMVKSISANAAKLNIENGTLPDIISYGAGISGFENYIAGKEPYYTWCNGGYCILTLDTTADFSDINAKNTIVNIGIENLSGAAALLCGLSDAKTAKPTAAYVQLINGKFKYLLGTQRDIFRLKTREVSFAVKPIEEFNDLYQNISIITTNKQKYNLASQYIRFLLSNSNQVSKIGLMNASSKLYDDEMSIMEGIEYKTKLISPISELMKNELDKAIINCDENKLKNLLK